jgi:hypothetical protein
MADLNADLDALHDYLNRHFPYDGVSAPSWQQKPYCQDLRNIFDRQKTHGLSGEQIVSQIHGQWAITLEKPLTTAASRSLRDLEATLLAWDLYLYAAFEE